MSVTTHANLNGSRLIAETLAELMAEDDSIIVFGEDVGQLGGVFGATRNLQRRFGPTRVLDTPISEMAFMGLATGAAQAGLKPIVELMFVDFVGVCFDQIFNQMAKNTYMSGGAVTVPVVIRTAVGCIGAAAQHSQVLTGTFAHVPGLKVVLPGAPGDLPGLLKTAVADPNPVVFLEHKRLLKARPDASVYPGAQGSDPIPFGQAQTVLRGGDLTIVASGWMVQEAMSAAALLASDGIHVDLIDLRTIVPLDIESICDSVRRTKRLLVVDEDYLSFGVSGEVVARVVEQVRPAPTVMRLALADVPVPASKPLEEAVLPNAKTIAQRAADLLRA